jgi:hypothetical protein
MINLIRIRIFFLPSYPTPRLKHSDNNSNGKDKREDEKEKCFLFEWKKAKKEKK